MAGNARLRLLKEDWEKAVNGYLLELFNFWGLDSRNGYWIDQEHTLFAYGDGITLNIEDIIFCVENSVSYEEFYEWFDYCVWASEFNQDIPNLKSWRMGCPRVSKEGQEKLTKAKRDLNDLIEETKNNLKNVKK